MNIIQGIFSDRIINALGWTILHSLWQGIIIGGMLMLLLFLFRNSNAVIRYNLSVFSLVFIFCLSVLTFSWYFRGDVQLVLSNDYSGNLLLNNGKELYGTRAGSNLAEIALPLSLRYMSDALSVRFPLIIGIWLLGVFIVSIRMTGGIFVMQKLRKTALFSLPENLLKRFRILSHLMNIRREVMIYESSEIKVPSVLGYLRPVILLPISVAAQIPIEQLEAIVAHELAHIRRHDYLVNLFQSVLEALFFYNPAVWLIQKHIREERENCCDDIAVSYSGSQIIYIKALASIHEIPVQTGFPILAMSSGKYHLLNRVLRILKNGKMKTNLKDKLLAGLLLASAIVIILLNTGGKFISFRTEKPISIIPESVTPALPVATNDTTIRIKDNVIQRTFFRNGKEMDMKMRIEKGEVTELTINGDKIPEKDYGKYQTEIDKTLDDVAKLEEDLNEANEQLNQVDMEKIRMEVEKSMFEAQKKIQEIDVEAMVERLEDIHVPEIDEEKLRQEIEQAMQEIRTIDTEKIRAEMEEAMESISDEMKNIEFPDMEELKLEIDKAMQEVKEIDQEKIQKEIQEALSDIQIDKEEIRKEIQHSLQEIQEINMEDVKKEFETEKMKMDEMLREIEKLELEKK